MIKLKPKQQSEAIELVKSSYCRSLDAQRPLFVKYNEYYQLYRAIRDNKRANYAGRARLFIPYIFATIETILPRLIGNRPNIEAVPREPNDIQNAKINNSLFAYQWDLMGMKEIVKSWVKQALIYGTGVIKLGWEFAEKNDLVEKDHPKAELVDLFDFFYDPDATSLKNARYAIHRAERNLEDLQKNPNYTIPKQLATKVNQDEYKVQRDAILGITKGKDPNAKKVEVLEYFGLYDLGGGEEECLLVVANQEFLIRAEKNPYTHGRKPFVRLLDVEDPHRFEGIGEVEQLSSLQYELNDVRNQRMDNVTLILNRMWKVLKSGGVDEEDLISQAGQVVHCDDMNAVEQLETADVTQSAYNEETLIKQDMQLVSGVSDSVAGNNSGGQGSGNISSTATGIALLQEAGNARFKYKLDNIEDSLREFGEQLLALNQQFMDQETVIRVVGEGENIWARIAPEDIKGEYDITIEAGSTQPMNKSVRRAEARELLQTVAPFAQFGLDITYFIKYLLKTYDLTNLDEAFPQQGMAGAMAGQGLPQEAPGASPGAEAMQGMGSTGILGQQADMAMDTGIGQTLPQ